MSQSSGLTSLLAGLDAGAKSESIAALVQRASLTQAQDGRGEVMTSPIKRHVVEPMNDYFAP